jgi:hypothetical protein
MSEQPTMTITDRTFGEVPASLAVDQIGRAVALLHKRHSPSEWAEVAYGEIEEHGASDMAALLSLAHMVTATHAQGYDIILRKRESTNDR